MLSPRMQDALNAQLQRELYASHLYLAMAACADAANLPGFAHWMRAQSNEERGHALRFYDFINDRDGRVVLKAIEQPPMQFDSPLTMFQEALNHERRVSGFIHELYELAVEEKDYPSQTFLQWFINEQVEEEKSATQIVETLKMIADNQAALLMLDRELGRRAADE